MSVNMAIRSARDSIKFLMGELMKSPQKIEIDVVEALKIISSLNGLIEIQEDAGECDFSIERQERGVTGPSVDDVSGYEKAVNNIPPWQGKLNAIASGGAENIKRPQGGESIQPTTKNTKSKLDSNLARSERIDMIASHPAYTTISGWCEISGLNRTAVYRQINDGNLRVVKVGKRTMVDVRHGLDWMASI